MMEELLGSQFFPSVILDPWTLNPACRTARSNVKILLHEGNSTMAFNVIALMLIRMSNSVLLKV